MESRLFTNLDNSEIQLFLSKMQIENFQAGTVLFSEEDDADKMFLIESGSIDIYINRKNKEINLAVLSKGDFLGEMGILIKEKRTANARVKEDCNLYSIDRGTFWDIINNNGKLAAKVLLNLAEILAERLAKTDKEVENWFLINDALIENEAFRKIYFRTHKK